MSDEAAFLVDILLPKSDVRQWTFTFPFALRYLEAKDKTRITAILNIAIRLLFSWQRRLAKKIGHPGAKTAAVTFVQRFGSARGLNVHLHVIAPDGVFVLAENDTLRLVPLPAPSDEDIQAIVQKLARKVSALCESRVATLDDSDSGVMERAILEAMRKNPLYASINEPSENDDLLLLQSSRAPSKR